MRIGLVVPWKVDETWRQARSHFNLPPLGMLQLAAVTPDGVELELVDEGRRTCPTEARWDAVAMSVLTAAAPRAYELADAFRARGLPVVMGGSHPTALPEEAARHADAVAIGEGEAIWPEIVEDLRSGSLRERYEASQPCCPQEIPPARRDLMDPGAYRFPWTLQASRGCPHDCAFCSTTAMWGYRYRFRPVSEVAREVASLPGRFLIFTDDNLFASEDYAVELLRAMIPLGKRWVSQATLHAMADRPELPRLAKRAGCLAILVGFETTSPENLADVGKGVNEPERYREQVEMLHRCGILVQGSFVLGMDADTTESLSELPEYIERIGIDTAGFCILTPLPGTRIFRRFEAEERLLTRDWSRFNRHDVVFRPRNMKPRELKDLQMAAYRRTYSWASIGRRATWRWPHAGMYWPYNLNYRRGVHRMERRYQRDLVRGLI